MAFGNIFKKKKETKGGREEGPKEVQPVLVEKKTRPTESARLQAKAPMTGKKKTKAAVQNTCRILRAPHITEKATGIADKNQYTFRVFPKANKVEIKKAVEGVYGVNVTDVNIVNVLRKRRRLGKVTGWKPGYKKAIVTVKEGQKIELLPR